MFLPKVHNAFCSWLKKISFDFDTFAVAIQIIKCEEGRLLKVSGNKRFGCSICNKTLLFKMAYFKICCCTIARTMEKSK